MFCFALQAKLNLSYGYKGKKKKASQRATLCNERVLTKVVKEKMRSQIILLVSTVERGVILTLDVERGYMLQQMKVAWSY